MDIHVVEVVDVDVVVVVLVLVVDVVLAVGVLVLSAAQMITILSQNCLFCILVT